MLETISKKNGFTLVEIIISIALLSIASVVALRLFVTSVEMNTRSRQMDIASIAATNYIEMICSYDSTDGMLDDMSSLRREGSSFIGTIQMNDSFTAITDTSLTAPVFVLECTISPENIQGLYSIDVNVVNLLTEDVLADYDTGHYFRKEVSAYE